MNAALDSVRNLYGAKSRDFITAVDEKNVIVVKDLALNEGYDEMFQEAEAMKGVVAVSYTHLDVYKRQAYNHYERDESMYIHRPDPGLSTAENLLMLLRPDKQYSFLEAKVLDVALMLHMEHGEMCIRDRRNKDVTWPGGRAASFFVITDKKRDIALAHRRWRNI